MLLSVSVKPVIRRDGTNTSSVIENRPVNLPCPASGNPPPVITWYKDDQRLTGNEIGVSINSDGSLDLSSAGPNDAGTYRCEATNPAGREIHIIELEIFCKLPHTRHFVFDTAILFYFFKIADLLLFT